MIEVGVYLLVALLVATYVGYPGVMVLLARMRPYRVHLQGRAEGPVFLVISVHNEEQVLERKLENAVAICSSHSPPVQIIVADDQSSDGTRHIVQSWSARKPGWIRWVHQSYRGGKNRALNQVLEGIPSGIVVFSDANALYAPDALEKMLSFFGDPSVGCVVGQLRLTREGQTLEGAYWRYEHALKVAEGRLGRMVVGNGTLIASRRDCIFPLLPGVANDLQMPLQAARAGKRTVFAPDAQAFEPTSRSTGEEFGRKARMATRGFYGVFPMFRLAPGWLKVQFLFHKVFRWLTGVMLLVLLGLNLCLLDQRPFLLLLFLQGLFYLASFVGWILETLGRRAGLLSFPWYFVSMHAAGLVGLWRFVTRRPMEVWEKPASTREL